MTSNKKARALAGVAALIILLTASFAGISFIRGGLSARDKPSLIEKVLAGKLRSMAVPSRAKNASNPLPLTDENVRDGMAHWADHCAQCHANNGSGNMEIGKNLYPKAPDMRKRDTQELTDGELYYTIQNGIRLTGMPAWGSRQDGENNLDSWKLVLFIRHLPQLAAEEEDEMKRLNPKSPEELKEEQEEEQFLNEGQTSNRYDKTTHHKD